jgi:hypothetical protein
MAASNVPAASTNTTLAVRVVFGQDKMDQLDESPGKLDPRGASAHDDKGHQCALAGRIRFNDCAFEGGEYVVTQRFSVRQFLEVKGIAFNRCKAEIIGYAAGSNDEVVVGNWYGIGQKVASGKIDPGRLGKLESCAGPTPGHGANRMGNGFLFQPCGCYLVEQWLEQMVIIPVNKDNIEPLAGEGSRRADSTESHAHDDDPFFPHISLIPDIFGLYDRLVHIIIPGFARLKHGRPEFAKYPAAMTQSIHPAPH